MCLFASVWLWQTLLLSVTLLIFHLSRTLNCCVIGVGRGLAAAQRTDRALLGLGLTVAVATQLAPDLGGLAQRYVMTAIPFNLAIENIRFSRDRSGHPVHFVQVRWVA